MLQPVLTSTPTNALPNAGLVVPRPVQQEQSSSSTRNLTSNPVRQNSEADDVGPDSEQDREQRVDGNRAAFAFSRGSGRGGNLDIFV
ncbi:hypothetical protein [Thalassobaculum litoreum]|uniref:Uncharacterized protein n=1 Tax=Thalassobaculum litoreum DSM 18839 TaxID=1123362 RepID=A0A8G2BIL8_9PROT|nr:hypothetical protein [Thalassobaculum litoreum]SDF92781.1 hypothetical protein SAMN05660686_02755 [Thalassobaculum litoreum DSM 18839]